MQFWLNQGFHFGAWVNPPNMSWGSLLSDGKAVIDIAWWLSFFPGLMIFIITFV